MNLVCLDIQETQVSKVLWEILVCLDYQEALERKGSQACLDSQVNVLFLTVSFPLPFLPTLTVLEATSYLADLHPVLVSNIISK